MTLLLDRKTETRRRIQVAARQLIEEKSAGRVQVEQIARTAGLSVGSIYNYFASKDDLLISLLDGAAEVGPVELDALLCLASRACDQVTADSLNAARKFVAQLGPRVERTVAQVLRARLAA